MMNPPTAGTPIGGPTFFEGTEVYDATGQKVGTLSAQDAQARYLVVQKGWLFTEDLYIPFSFVGGQDSRGIFLTVSREDLNAEHWKVPPTPSASVAPQAPPLVGGSSQPGVVTPAVPPAPPINAFANQPAQMAPLSPVVPAGNEMVQPVPPAPLYQAAPTEVQPQPVPPVENVVGKDGQPVNQNVVIEDEQPVAVVLTPDLSGADAAWGSKPDAELAASEPQQPSVGAGADWGKQSDLQLSQAGEVVDRAGNIVEEDAIVEEIPPTEAERDLGR